MRAATGDIGWKQWLLFLMEIQFPWTQNAAQNFARDSPLTECRFGSFDASRKEKEPQTR